MTWRAWWSRLRGTLRRDESMERDMEREMTFHLDMATSRNEQRGLAPEAARRNATLAFGSMQLFKEEAREAHRARVIERLVSDVRFALRTLRRSPAFTVTAVLTLGLGIAASTAIFTVVNAVLLRPLPIPAPEDFRYLGWAWAEGNDIPALTDLKFEFVRDHNRIFDAVAAYRTQEMHLGDPSTAQPVRGLRVTSGFFRTIGFFPQFGRVFDANELETEAAVVILGDQVWRARFGADSGIVGSTIRLDGELRTVVGVLPREFHLPDAPEYAGYLVPLMIRGNPNDEGHNTEVVGRLRPGTTTAAQNADLLAMSSAFRAAHPSATDTGSFRLFTHIDVHVGDASRRTLWLLFAASTLVMLIACVNTATLLLVRGTARLREIAVRASIGASPRRIVQQLLTEGLVLSSIGAVVGVAMSVAALRAFLAAAPVALPVAVDPGIDARVLSFAVTIVIATGLIFGLVGAMPAWRSRLQSVLLGAAHGGTTGSSRVRDTLVFLQTAVAVVLLAGASLLAASFTRLIRVDPGFDAERVVAIRMGRLPPEFNAARREQLVDQLVNRLRETPGVEQVAAAPNLPLERGLNFPIDVPERPELGIGAVELRFVSPGYLETLGVPLRGGRHLDDGDVVGAEPVAIVNEAFARHFWKDAAPTGRTIRIGHFRDSWRVGPAWRHETRVVGVAADIHELGLDRPARPTVLVPRAQHAQGAPVLLVRTTQDVLPGVLREQVIAEEPRLVPVVERLSSVVSRSVAAPRFRTMLVGSFAGFALLLAGVGIYGVIASSVQYRRREIALRLALGANHSAVAIAVSRRCLQNVAAGVLVGLLAFWMVRRLLTSWLYEMTPGNPAVLTGAVAVLAFVAAIASWLPTRRATRVDPAAALRLD